MMKTYNIHRISVISIFSPILVKFTIVFCLLCVAESSRREVYFLALVDILTHYGVKKRTAQAAKTVKHGAGAEISTVKPDQYAKRFMDFIARIIQ